MLILLLGQERGSKSTDGSTRALPKAEYCIQGYTV